MLKFLMKRSMRKFGRHYGYDVGYVEHIIDVDAAAIFKLSKVQGIASHRRGIPAEPWYAAKIRTVLGEDCGPCTQLAVNMALEAGVAPERVRAIVERDLDRLPSDTALVIRFTELALAHDPAADPLREEITALWGEAAVVSLALGIAATRVYPTLKYVGGYGQACSRVTVADRTVPAVRAEPAVHLAAQGIG